MIIPDLSTKKIKNIQSVFYTVTVSPPITVSAGTCVFSQKTAKRFLHGDGISVHYRFGGDVRVFAINGKAFFTR